VLFREGDPGVEMFYVLDGLVRLSRGGVPITEIGADRYFGEMALLVNAPRSATAVGGDEGATLARVSEENFEIVLRENPHIVLQILEEMAGRLRSTNEQLEKAAQVDSTTEADLSDLSDESDRSEDAA